MIEFVGLSSLALFAVCLLPSVELDKLSADDIDLCLYACARAGMYACMYMKTVPVQNQVYIYG